MDYVMNEDFDYYDVDCTNTDDEENEYHNMFPN